MGDKAFIYLTAPGVAVHELSHAFFCVLFGHKIIEMKLFSPDEDGTLGYVQHTWNSKNLWHKTGNFFIGTGPIWCGIAVLLTLNYFLLSIPPTAFGGNFLSALQSFFQFFSHPGIWQRWQTWLWLYAVFAIASHITLSPSDLKGALSGFWILVVLLLLLHTGAAFFPGGQNKVLQWSTRLQNSLAGIAIGFAVFFAALALILFLLAHIKKR